MDRSPIKEQNLPQRRRRTQAKQNKDAPRYQCFCSKQYLSYPALYLHLKNKHINYFINNRGTRKVQATKLIESYDSTEGYKIFKIPIQNINNMGQLDHQKKDQMTAKHCSANKYPQNPLFYPSYLPYFPYQFDYMGQNHPSHKFINPQAVPIETAVSIFMETQNKLQVKERQETQLFLFLFLECLNKNYERLKDERTVGKQIKRYSAEYNCSYLFRITNYFEEVYLPQLIQKQNEPFSFYLNNAYLITSEAYKKVIRELFDFLYHNDQLDKSNSQPQQISNEFFPPKNHEEESSSKKMHHKSI